MSRPPFVFINQHAGYSEDGGVACYGLLIDLLIKLLAMANSTLPVRCGASHVGALQQHMWQPPNGHWHDNQPPKRCHGRFIPASRWRLSCHV